MTNHWADIANTTLVLAWGANPAENHPACIAHVGRARFPKDFFPVGDTRRNKKPAQLIVVDPRKTRTASLCNELDTSKSPAERDRYIRIRPGTDIALSNGLVRYMIQTLELRPEGDPVRVGFFRHLDQRGSGTFWTDGNGTTAAVSATGNVPATGTAGGNSKYTDARFLINNAGTDYKRGRIVAASGLIVPDTTPKDAATISEFPLKAATCNAVGEPTVFNKLKEHVAPYTREVVADICGCTIEEIKFLGDALIAHSKGASGIIDGAPGVDSNGLPIVKDAREASFRATTILYAMGITQHTCGAQNIKSFAVLQTLLGNMGRQGGGINALRGIHNVQGSTDMGLLYGNIPAYSGNPGLQVDGGPDWRVTPSTNNAFGKYMDALWGLPLSGSGKVQNGSYDDAYNTGQMALQQRGFYNMTLKWFGNYAYVHGLTLGSTKRAAVDALYSLWPKGNGHDHVTMFRDMASGLTKAAVVWGQNPAITEPNQGAVRAGLYNLDTLVCTDIFENETHAVKRKPGSVTYLIPAAATCEKAGSATNSGRTLQWRYEATKPAGNSKDDNELLLRFAKALDNAGAFSRIKDVWVNNGITYDTSVYKQLFELPYGGYIGTGNGFNALAGPGELVNVRKLVSEPVTYNIVAPTETNAANFNLFGSEWVAECVYREFTSPNGAGGTMWIYTGGYNSGLTWITDNIPTTTEGTVGAAVNVAAQYSYGGWQVMNRAKSRDRQDPAGQFMTHGWGYSWLVNRRVFYNNSDVPGDVPDFFMGADSCSRFFVATAPPAILNYSRWYRTYHKLADMPSPVLAGNSASPHYAVTLNGTLKSLAGKFPGHTEPYETPRQDLSAETKWGRNTKNGSAWDLVKADTKVAGRGTTIDPPASKYPLTLTTIRCVEHFQGGPITRNNPWNVELEPDPWIELNSLDARKFGIRDGEWVRIVTARTEGVDVDATIGPFGQGFKARVGVGVKENQRVGVGVVAIPWHWGEKGLSTGSRANDLCIDAGDANTVIPEYKACLCRIEKM